ATIRGASVALGGLLALAACTHTVTGTASDAAASSSSSGATATTVPVNAGQFCRLLVTDCGTLTKTLAECVATVSAIRASPECANQVPSATCANLSELGSACFPPCDPGTPTTCHPDGTITACGGGYLEGVDGLVTVTCDGICRLQNRTWTG